MNSELITHAPDTPVLFLDVDGVLNAFPNGATMPTEKLAEYSVIKANPESDRYGHRYRITYRYAVIRQLQEWHDNGRIKIVWATTWGSGANGELSEKIGFKRYFESVGEPPQNAWYGQATVGNGRGSSVWWKSEAVHRYLQEHPEVQRLIWIDDDHVSWDVSETIEGRDALVICTNPETGITNEELDSIDEFLMQDVH